MGSFQFGSQSPAAQGVNGGGLMALFQALAPLLATVSQQNMQGGGGIGDHQVHIPTGIQNPTPLPAPQPPGLHLLPPNPPNAFGNPLHFLGANQNMYNGQNPLPQPPSFGLPNIFAPNPQPPAQTQPVSQQPPASGGRGNVGIPGGMRSFGLQGGAGNSRMGLM